MYQHVCRRSGFAFVRRRFPDLLGAFRFFYRHPPTVWFGGRRVPVTTDPDTGKRTLATPGTPGAEWLTSAEGGVQGCGGATVLCVGAAHEALSVAQRLCPDADLAATADDTYVSDELDGDGPTSPLASTTATVLACLKDGSPGGDDEGCNLDSNRSKALVFSAVGDLSRAPALPGSPRYSLPSDPALEARRREPVRAFPVAGVWVGEPAACSAELDRSTRARLRPLGHVARLADTEHVRHALQLAVLLLRLVASAIPCYWMCAMPPEQTADAAAYATAATHDAAAALLRFVDSPAARRQLARASLALPVDLGGLNLTDFTASRFACFLASLTRAWPCCTAVCPALAALAVTAFGPLTPTLEGARSALQHLTRVHAHNRARRAALDAVTRVWVDGTHHTAFSPVVHAGFALPDLAHLFDDDARTLATRSQRTLACVANQDAWFRAKQLADDFDTANDADSRAHRREGARLVSYAQTGGNAFHQRHPDDDLKGSKVPSDRFLAKVQYALGLYQTCLAPGCDAAAARGLAVSQSERLGDSALAAANHTARHNAGTFVVYSALRALTADSLPHGVVRLGDKGDGSKRAKEEAKQKHGHLNCTHVPDLYRGLTWVGEYKSYSWVVSKARVNFGTGTAATGGGASNAEGWLFAQGGTEEHLRVLVFGTRARGRPADGPLNRLTGLGYVREHDGHYADALSKRRDVSLVATETSGAVNAAFDALLRSHDRTARLPATHDATVYGANPSNTRNFRRHYLAAHAAAVTDADALTLLDAADALGHRLARAAPAATA